MSAQIKINSIDLVGTWNYTSSNKECLCGCSLQQPTKLQVEKKNMYRNNVIFGECGHAFHDTCIKNNTTKKCPQCEFIWAPVNTNNNLKYSVMN